MKYIAINCVLVLLFFISQINQIQCTCVLESDFGFSFNCNFKKSGLFRVRNLGGVKAHFGLGFSVGDELGFPESLGNLEGNKKRALNLRTGANSIIVLPAAKMPITEPSPPIIHKVQQIRSQTEKSAQPQQQFMQQNYLQAMTPSPKQYRSLQMQTPDSRPRPILSTPQGFRKPSQMTLATSLPLGVPAFRPIPHESLKVNTNNVVQMNTIPPSSLKNYEISNSMGFQQYPPFQTLPNSLSRISQGPIYEIDGKYNSLQAHVMTHDQQVPHVDLKGHTEEELAVAANVSVEVIRKAIKMRQNQMMAEQKNYAMQLQHQLSYQQPTTVFTTQRPTIQTTARTIAITTTEVYKPKKKVNNRPLLAGGHKVMNAPKEYYPVGYDKNFDDNFVSKVELPATSFHCGDQKHFPGLYGDEDLGCMVFHVCALTDDGLIMKSFLCPESTLFDQTILKCNWWFYTDCNKSKTLYDSNLPVSKSYQLMKALSFFSSYKKNSNATSDATEGSGFDVEALKKSVDASNASLKILSDEN